MKYRAYTQKDWNAEKFYIEDENQNALTLEADNEEQAKEKFIDYIMLTSPYDYEVTCRWIDETPITVEEA